MADWWPCFGAFLCFSLSLGWIEGSPTGGGGDSSCRIPNSESFIYMGLQYIIFYDTVTWDEAAAICPTYKATLANVESMEKATALAEALAESNRRLSDVWLGARKLNGGWIWLLTSNVLPTEQGQGAYPPWLYFPERPERECLALDRQGHRDPVFVDVGCTQLKPFVCERSKDMYNDEPQESRRVRSGNSVFTLFHGRLDWFNAVSHCRKLGRRLAVVNSPKIIYLLSQAMTKSRPDFETAWIGGKYSYGSWKWAPTGEVIPDLTDSKTLFPPWKRKNNTRRVNGCVLLDRHMCDEAMFFDSNCHRTRDFICEEYTVGSNNNLNDVQRFRFNNITFEIDPANLTWEEGNEICKMKGGHLAYIQDSTTLEFIIDLMAETPGSAVSHAWIGGEIVKGEWIWSGTEDKIPPPGGGHNFPPWCDSKVHFDMPCLNLDRTDHSKPAFYGLECNNTQPSVCQVDCLDPENVDHGKWTCSPAFSKEVRTCNFQCYENFRMFGSNYFYCSLEGWLDNLGHNIAPECITPEDYGFLLFEKISMQIEREKIHSMLFVVEDSQNVSDEALEGMLAVITSLAKAIPLTESLRGGVTIFGERIVQFLALNVVNSCTIVRNLPSALGKRVLGKPNLELALSGVRQQISVYGHGQRSIIVMLVATDQQSDVISSLYEELQEAGHIFYIIALNETTHLSPTSTLFKMATTGPDESFNIFVYENSKEFKELSALIEKKLTTALDCTISDSFLRPRT